LPLVLRTVGYQRPTADFGCDDSVDDFSVPGVAPDGQAVFHVSTMAAVRCSLVGRDPAGAARCDARDDGPAGKAGRDSADGSSRTIAFRTFEEDHP
jgi:hypothetical protein